MLVLHIQKYQNIKIYYIINLGEKLVSICKEIIK